MNPDSQDLLLGLPRSNPDLLAFSSANWARFCISIEGWLCVLNDVSNMVTAVAVLSGLVAVWAGGISELLGGLDFLLLTEAADFIEMSLGPLL